MSVNVCWVLLSLSLLACAPKPPAAFLISPQEKSFLDKMKLREQARTDLERAPSRLIEGGDWDRYDKGIINDYTRAAAVEFTNHSAFDVSDIRGKITYLSPHAVEMATVPFSAVGELRAGEQVKLPVSAGEISGKATKAHVTVEFVRVHN